MTVNTKSTQVLKFEQNKYLDGVSSVWDQSSLSQFKGPNGHCVHEQGSVWKDKYRCVYTQKKVARIK